MADISEQSYFSEDKETEIANIRHYSSYCTSESAFLVHWLAIAQRQLLAKYFLPLNS